VQIKVKLITVNVDLINYPGSSNLVIVTNLPKFSSNLTKFLSGILVILSSKQNISSTCTNSTNPPNFGNYSISTNFISASSNYSYQILNGTSSFMTNISTNLLVFLVSNIIFDCTTDINIYLPSGLLFTGTNWGYWCIFDIIIN
jgi:hypothetical protein